LTLAPAMAAPALGEDALRNNDVTCANSQDGKQARAPHAARGFAGDANMHRLTDENVHRRVSRGICLIAAAVIVFALSGPSQGAPNVMDHPGGTLEQRRACKNDAMRFCQKEIPDIPKITACMTRNKKNLSALCRAQFK
jgi:hypothetical protein